MLSMYEVIAALFCMAYLYFTATLHPAGWFCAFVSTAIYTWLFFDVNLWMESLLNIFYLVMALYGFYCWVLNQKTVDKPVQSWTMSQHLKVGVPTVLVALMIGFILNYFSLSSMTYLDSLTTCFAIVATFMLIDKVIDNWIYWIAIDSLSIYMYLEKGLWVTSCLYCIYIAFALYNYFSWLKLHKVSYAY